MTLASNQFISISNEINNRNFSEAEKHLSEWCGQASLSEESLIEIEHLKGILNIQKGHLELAVDVLSAALVQFGDHIGLLMELSCCYYQLSQWSLWRSHYKKLYELLRTKKNGPLTFEVEATILLGKFFEEEGEIARAREIYQSGIENLSYNSWNSRVRMQIQLLRLEATFGSKESVGPIYSELIQIKETETSLDQEIEREHALMLSEMNLVGPLHASERLLKILNMDNILCTDKSLLLYDFLEECVVNKYEIPETAKKWCESIRPSDEFETMIWNLVSASGSKMSLTQLMTLASQVSPSCYLRLLTLALQTLPQYAGEIKNKLNLLLSAIEGTSKHLWNKRIDTFTESSSKLLKFDLEKRMISFESKDIDLSRKRGMLVFAEIIAQKREMSVEDMIEKIWQTDYSPDHFHRLRMTAHRMNQLLFDLTSIERPIEVNSDKIKLNPKIKFQCFGSEWSS